MVDTAVADAVVEVKVTLVPTEQIDDNPYNPRQSYVQDEIEAMGDSLVTFGLREVATGRRKDGRVQLAFGHKRLRGFRRNEKIVPEKKRDQWKVFPLIIKDLTDTQMFDYALVENLQRSDVKPIEIARALAKFTEDNPTVKDKEIAKKHGMSEANISNMRRVLRLPQKFLDMINEGVISFTQGRELLTLEKKACADQLMNESLAYVLDGSFPNTVEGLQGAIKKTLEKYFSTEEKKGPENKLDTGTNISQENKTGAAEKITGPADPEAGGVVTVVTDPVAEDLKAKTAREKSEKVKEPAAATATVIPVKRKIMLGLTLEEKEGFTQISINSGELDFEESYPGDLETSLTCVGICLDHALRQWYKSGAEL